MVAVVAPRASLGGGINKLVAASLPKQALALGLRLRHVGLDGLTLGEGDLLNEAVQKVMDLTRQPSFGLWGAGPSVSRAAYLFSDLAAKATSIGCEGCADAALWRSTGLGSQPPSSSRYLGSST